MDSSYQRDPEYAVHKGHGVGAHGHAAEGCHGKGHKKQDVDPGLQQAECFVFSFKKRSVPPSVQNLVDNAENGLAYACEQMGAEVLEYTAAPVFMDANAKCRHQWLIEFSKPPQDLKQFAALLDKHLQEINSDYEAKRYKNITLQPLEIIVARQNLFNDWLKLRGKLGGQHKVPRLSNSRDTIEQLIKMNEVSGEK